MFYYWGKSVKELLYQKIIAPEAQYVVKCQSIQYVFKCQSKVSGKIAKRFFVVEQKSFEKLVVHPFQFFFQAIKKIRDPRSKRGITHDFQTILAILFLGLLANVSTLAEIERWAKRQFLQLKKFIPFKRNRDPSDNTFARALQSITLSDLHAVFAEFINAIAANEISVVAVDGKVAKQMKDEDGNPILMLNIFAQKIKLVTVHG